MRDLARERGATLIDMIVGLVLFSLLLLAVYHLHLPTFALWRTIDRRLAAQQDVRLAVDRVARALQETTLALGRFRVYTAADGCSGAYEACIGFVTARDGDCTGTFQLATGEPDWRATMYVWRDMASNELRLRCDVNMAFPVQTWPPPHLDPATVIATHVVAASFSLEPAESVTPTAVIVALAEQVEASARSPNAASQAILYNSTVFVPRNR